MNVLDVILIGIALSMDACAITIANCSTHKTLFKEKKAWSMPVFFSLFQGVMPLIGFFVGSIFSKYLEAYAGYLVSAVFLALSVKIVIDLIKEKKESLDTNKNEKSISLLVVLLQAFLTSIDALIIGVTMSMTLTFSIFYAVIIIALVTALLVITSLFIGKFLGIVFGRYAEWVGAFILFALAVKEFVGAII